MSLITQCPACGTLFKVVADQLKISEGWVRCGQCREVFDANAQITTVQEARALSHSGHASYSPTTPSLPNFSNPVVPSQATEQDTSPSVNHPKSTIEAPSPHAASMLKNDAFLSDDWINTVNPPAPRNNTPQDTRIESKFGDPISSRGDLPELDSPPSVFPDDLLAEHAALNTDNAPLAATSSAAAAERRPTPMPTPGFVRQAQRAERWRKPWVRAGLVMVCLALLLGLVAQIALAERARLVAMFPQTQPWLRMACAQIGCSVEPLKQIESMVVDSSAFNKIKSSNAQDAYRLTVALKNTANVPLALPHIELSLTDTQEGSVLRRVLSPADLGATGQVVAANGDFAGAVSVQIDAAQLGGARVAGYRVLAFYP